jgi:hypothetical protein
MLRKIQNLVVAFGLLAMGFVFTSPVHAEGDCAGGITGKCNPICQSDADEQQKAAAGCTTDANDNVSKTAAAIGSPFFFIMMSPFLLFLARIFSLFLF